MKNIPEWLVLLLNERSHFELEGGKLSGTTDYIYSFSAESFIGWLTVVDKHKRRDLEIILRIRWDEGPDSCWEYPKLLIDVWHKSFGESIQGEEVCLDIGELTPDSFCQQLDYLLGLVVKKWGKAE
jgi:hypothetical protein